MREDNAEKSARDGLRDYAKPSDSRVERVKACGCPLAGCTVACRRGIQQAADEYKATISHIMQAAPLDNI